MRSSWRVAAAFIATIAVVFVAVNVAATRVRFTGFTLPEYGIWSGVLELEEKIRLLEAFAREGPVDALIVSSSMGDLGVSAETLTQELSTRHGRAFRVFNFSIG